MFLVTLTPLAEDGSSTSHPELPIIQVHSHPMTYQKQLPNITNAVRLGRNARTKISDISLSRNIASLWLTETGEMKLLMHKLPEEHTVSLDGSKINVRKNEFLMLKNGCEIALLDGKYRYRISLENLGSDNNRARSTSTSLPAAATTRSAITPSPTQLAGATSSTCTTATSSSACVLDEKAVVKERTLKQMREELMCPVCMDILVNTVALNPCGHLFCSTCVQVAWPCPTCRTVASGTVAVKQVDGVTLQMVKGGYFPTDDARYFLGRTGHTVSNAELACIANSDAASTDVGADAPAVIAAADMYKQVVDRPEVEICDIRQSPKRRRRNHQQMQSSTVNFVYAPFCPHPIAKHSDNVDVVDLT